MRVDCWADAPGLIAWYERQGFVRCSSFEQNGWVGQIFDMTLYTRSAQAPRGSERIVNVAEAGAKTKRQRQRQWDAPLPWGADAVAHRPDVLDRQLELVSGRDPAAEL